MSEPYFEKYLRLVKQGRSHVENLKDQTSTFLHWCQGVEIGNTTVCHGSYTWTLCEVLNHLTDTERVFAFRALWVARGADSPLPSFDENEFSRNAGTNKLNWNALIEEFAAVRNSTIWLFANVPNEAWTRQGIVAGYQVDLNMLFGMIYGHLEHHFQIMISRLA